ncbi:NAD(P)/FAD-dependent oxidoreductase [Ancylobacter sp. SL191]|uniref:NAD(P)/FAD-dependent oxidoreductase n=1 Tax=Ancylobacter sp. SL191 TaxID=2995166 RepID=UPI002270E1EB|nr:FAD-dependent oxidoreductase [Ancylobacter sp. SL191]WAC29599.1 FAD-dependent oxidoreductase [Ancylobacter sp. SL191]
MELLPTLKHAVLRPYWFDTVAPAPAQPPLASDTRADLAIIGGGFTGLWTALKARERDPQARIVLVEAGRTGNAASGRNGGFCAPSISHGLGNALRRWPREVETLIRLGRANLDAYADDVARYGLDIEFERPGKLSLAATPWQIEGLTALAASHRRFGIESHPLTGAALAEKLSSPVYGAGLFEPNYAQVNPAKTVAELRRVVLSQGVELYEDTPVTALRTSATGIELVTPGGVIQAGRAVLATNAAPPLLRRLRPSVIPIFDYAIMTRPLTEEELASIGWTGRHSLADSGNQFHYIRKSADNRILWGGYDAVYHFGSRRDAALLDRAETYNKLATHFARALPPLADVTFTHAWGGIIDTSARTTFFAGLAARGKLAYAMGFTGQGVSASRFAALTMLDLLDGVETERTRLAMSRTRPFPFPPEPLRWLGVRLAQIGLAQEDRDGRRSRFNRLLDAMGVGFDS